MKFAVNPSRDTLLKSDMISRELTGMAYEPVPDDVKSFVEERMVAAGSQEIKAPATQEP